MEGLLLGTEFYLKLFFGVPFFLQLIHSAKCKILAILPLGCETEWDFGERQRFGHKQHARQLGGKLINVSVQTTPTNT